MSRSKRPAKAPRPSVRMRNVLLRAWQGSVPQEEWQRLDSRAMLAACAAQLAFGMRRRPRQTLVRVLHAAAADDARHSVIELVTDDMPFLVDTLNMTLA